MAIETLRRLKEGTAFDSEDDSDEVSDYGEDYEADDEVISVDEHLPNERRFDGPASGNDYGNINIADDEEKWLRFVAQVRKERGALTSKLVRSLSGNGDDVSGKGEDIQPSRIQDPLREQPRSRSPSSGPLTSKHFDFVLASDTASQSPAPVESIKAVEAVQSQAPIFSTRADFPDPSIHPGKTNGKFTPFHKTYPIFAIKPQDDGVDVFEISSKGYSQDKVISRPSSTPGSGVPSQPMNVPSLKRPRDGSEKETIREQPNPSSHGFSHPKLSDISNYGIPKPPHPFAAALPIDKSKYYVPPRTGDEPTGARPYFIGDGSFAPMNNGKDNTPIAPGNIGPRPTPRPFADLSGFTPILKSSASMPPASMPPASNSDLKPPRRTYKPRGSKNKEPGRPGRKPNNANTPTPTGYSHSEYSLQGKGRILSPKPAPTSSQMGYPPTGYPPPKFALPSNSQAQTSYLKQYTAASTPSPLRSQSRPPYDHRDIPNPTWAPVGGYTYGGPNPPQPQFQPSGDYNLDPSRSSLNSQAPYQSSPGYGSYSVPPSAPIRSTPGAPPPHPFLPANTNSTPFSGQSPYYTPSSAYVPPPAYVQPYPPPNPTWNTPITSNAPVLPSNSTPGKPYEPKSPPQFIRAPMTPQEPVKYYVGDGIYKTAPSTIERQISLPPSSQATVFEEDSYSINLNQLARNGNWGSGVKPGSGPVGPA